MSYQQQEQAVLTWVLEHALRFLQKRILWIILGLLMAWAFLLRCLHLLNPDRYYLLGPDSHFFHWLAQRVMAGEGPPPDIREGAIYTIHSGLAYPLAYIAQAVSSIFNVPSADALELVSKFLPPTLGIISLVIVYLAATRIYDRRVGFFAALAWALMLHALFLGAGGLIDRDGLNTFLIMLGLFLFYFSQYWHIRVRNKNAGWIVAGLGVLLIEGLLYLQWSVVGSLLLLVPIVVYFVVKLLLKIFSRTGTEVSAKLRIAAALNEVNWQTLALIIVGNVLVAAAFYHQASSWFGFLTDLVSYGRGSPVSELHGIVARDLTVYHFFLIPLVLGLYLAWRKRSNGSIFIACWFLLFLVLSLFAKRILFLAAPAACLFVGAGLAYIWDWAKAGQLRLLKRVGVAALLLLMVLVSFITAASIGADRAMSADKEWQDALTYLREETPQDSVIITQWSWGFWILDLGQRKPLVDNGFYGYPAEKLHDVGLVYTASDPSEAARIMKKYDADYIIFSALDLDVAKYIMEWAGLGEGHDAFSTDSMVARSLTNEFQSGGGLEVVYRSSPDSEVVILGLTQSGQP